MQSQLSNNNHLESKDEPVTNDTDTTLQSGVEIMNLGSEEPKMITKLGNDFFGFKTNYMHDVLPTRSLTVMPAKSTLA